MANLAKLLQERVLSIKPWGMKVFQERRLLPSEMERTLGFSPRVDVVLEQYDRSVRYWIEFEISRADPVANHTKFATSFLFQPFLGNDFFISMVSNHVTRGRNNLGASTIALMRRVGLRAFQTPLFPHFSGDKIKKLNHLPWEKLSQIDIDIQPELERIQTITASLGCHKDQDIHFVANSFDVYMNIYNWNRDIQTSKGRELWKRRTIKYFIYNPWTHEFAPSKFCAYITIPHLCMEDLSHNKNDKNFFMSIPAYIAIDQKNAIFDGYRARKHLVKNLGFNLQEADENILYYFKNWIKKYEQFIRISKKGPYFIS